MKFYHYILLVCLIVSFSSCSIFKSKSKGVSSKSKYGKLTKKAIIDKYSKLIGERVDNADLYAFIDQWIGVPYKYGGKSKAGIDCSNFTCETLRKAFAFPPNFYFPSSALAEQGQKVDPERAKEGDLVFFSINHSSKISHVGIYLTNNRFVHASTAKGVIISALDEDYYRSRFAFMRRIR